jgi:hypothetical protein
MQFKPPSIKANHKREPQKTKKATMGCTPFSPVAEVCLVKIAAETTATQKRIRTMETPFLTNPSIVPRVEVDEDVVSSLEVDMVMLTKRGPFTPLSAKNE